MFSILFMVTKKSGMTVFFRSKGDKSLTKGEQCPSICPLTSFKELVFYVTLSKRKGELFDPVTY